MKAVASTILLRSIMTGESLESIIAGSAQFDAYGKKMPAGTPAFRDLARQALDDVLQNGPIDHATFYARDYALSGLPRGLKQIGVTQDRHYRFVDPQMRSIATGHGFQPVNDYARMMRASTVRPSLADRFPVRQEERPSPPGVDAYVRRLSEFLARQPRTTPKTSRLPAASQGAAPGASTLPKYMPLPPWRPERPDPMGTRSIRGASNFGSYDPGPFRDERASSDSFAVPGRAGSAPLSGGLLANSGPLDTVALTRVIRQMQQAGASANEIRQMLAENRRRREVTRQEYR
jgi:hypothetical protein